MPCIYHGERLKNVGNLVYGIIGWERAVKYTELSLQSGRYVVSTTARVDHGRYEGDVNYVSKVTWSN